MTLESQSQTERQWDPPEELVNAQVKRIIQATRLKGRKKPALLLKYLIKIKYGERYLEPFSAQKPYPTGARILSEFYEHRERDFQEDIPAGGADIAGKALLARIRESLAAFYGASLDRSVVGDIRIDIGDGFNDAYEPMVSWIAETAQTEETRPSDLGVKHSSEEASLSGHLYPIPAPSPNSSLSDFRKLSSNAYRMSPVVDCHFLGNEEDATQYMADRIHAATSHSAKITSFSFVDTRPFHPDDPYGKDTETLESAINELADATIDTSSRRSQYCTVQLYISANTNINVRIALSDAVSNLNEEAVSRKFDCYCLSDEVPPIKLVEIGYEDETGEVLFGWGCGVSRSSYVFRSRDARLRNEFFSLFISITKSSRGVPLSQLSRLTTLQ